MSKQPYEMYICVFESFTINFNGKIIRLNEFLSKQTLSLFEVLVLNYDRYVSKETLIDLLWDHNENPESALKFNIFRLRKLLKSIPEFAEMELIQTDKNGYRFDPNVTWEVDAHEIDRIHSRLVSSSQYTVDEYFEMKNLLNLYKGKLFCVNTVHWFIQQAEHYRSIYLRYISPLCEYCLQNKRYDDVQQLSNAILELEPSNETGYYYLIMSYVKKGEIILAKEYYKKAVTILTEEYEHSLSQRMKNLRVNLESGNSKKKSVKEIINSYRNREFHKGAFYCANIVFDHIYEQRVRQSKRTKERFYLYVFEVNVGDDKAEIKSAMKKLEISIVSTLRCGDVFTKLNNSQYLALLSCPNDESAYRIACRVSNNFRAKDKNVSNRLFYFVNAINE